MGKGKSCTASIGEYDSIPNRRIEGIIGRKFDKLTVYKTVKPKH